MTNKRNRMGILTLILILGFSSTAYAQSQGGTFTLTDIPSMFNGMYVFLESGNINVELYGVQSVNWDDGIITLPRIVNGRVSIPMWIIFEDRQIGELAKYNGNNTVEVSILFFDSATLDNDSEEIAEIYFESVRFSNGSATMSFHDNDNFETY